MATTSDSTEAKVDEPPEGQRPITKEEYNNMGPFEKGYTNYWQGAWNPAVRECPYTPSTLDWTKWEAGQSKAMIDAQDSEE